MLRIFLDIMLYEKIAQATHIEVNSLLALLQQRPQHITNTAGAVFQWESALYSMP